MDITQLKQSISSWVRRNPYILLIVAVGLFLMLIPSHKEETSQVITAEPANILTLEDDLSHILSYVSGAGEVHVLLTQASGEEILYQTDESHSSSPDTSDIRIETVTVSDTDRNETGLIRQINPPSYLGAVIVCDGADDPSVRLAIVEAVSRATGLGANEISVLKKQ